MKYSNTLFAKLLHDENSEHQHDHYVWTSNEKMVLALFAPLTTLLYRQPVTAEETPLAEEDIFIDRTVTSLMDHIDTLLAMLTTESAETRRVVIATNEYLKDLFLKTTLFPAEFFERLHHYFIGDKRSAELDITEMNSLSRSLGKQRTRYRLTRSGVRLMDALLAQASSLRLSDEVIKRAENIKTSFTDLSLINEGERQLLTSLADAITTLNTLTPQIENPSTPLEREDALKRYYQAALVLDSALDTKGTRIFIGHNTDLLFDQSGVFTLFTESGHKAVPEGLFHFEKAKKTIVSVLKKILDHPNDLNYKKTGSVTAIIEGYIADAQTSDLAVFDKMTEKERTLFDILKQAVEKMHSVESYGDGASDLLNLFQSDQGKKAIALIKENRLLYDLLFSPDGLHTKPFSEEEHPLALFSKEDGLTGYQLYDFILSKKYDFGLAQRFGADNEVALGILEGMHSLYAGFASDEYDTLRAAAINPAALSSPVDERTLTDSPRSSLPPLAPATPRAAVKELTALMNQMKNATTFDEAIQTISDKINTEEKRESLRDSGAASTLFVLDAPLLSKDTLPEYLTLKGLKAAYTVYTDYLPNKNELGWAKYSSETTINRRLKEIGELLAQRIQKLEAANSDEELPEIQVNSRIAISGRIPTAEEALGPKRDTSGWDNERAKDVYDYIYKEAYRKFREGLTASLAEAAHVMYRQLTGRDISEFINLNGLDDIFEVTNMMRIAVLKKAVYETILVDYLPDDIAEVTVETRESIKILYQALLSNAARYGVSPLIQGKIENIIGWLENPETAKTRSDERAVRAVTEGSIVPYSSTAHLSSPHVPMYGQLRPGMPSSVQSCLMPWYHSIQTQGIHQKAKVRLKNFLLAR